jgi:alpha-glucosidase
MLTRKSLRALLLAISQAGLLFMFAMAGQSVFARNQPGAVDSEGHEWWQHAVFYEIYPRSFADSNNDGVGDLNGITSKIDYLRDLGVDAIWITPCYPSPQVDFGYDVADYKNIDPMYGTLADFDRMVAAGKKKNLRVILPCSGAPLPMRASAMQSHGCQCLRVTRLIMPSTRQKTLIPY